MVTDTSGIELILIIWYCTAYPNVAICILALAIVIVILLTLAVTIYDKLTKRNNTLIASQHRATI
jgi:hypothetical protein